MNCPIGLMAVIPDSQSGDEPAILQTHAVGAIRVSQKLRRPAYETGGGIPFHSPAIFFIGTPGLEPGT